MRKIFSLLLPVILVVSVFCCFRSTPFSTRVFLEECRKLDIPKVNDYIDIWDSYFLEFQKSVLNQEDLEHLTDGEQTMVSLLSTILKVLVAPLYFIYAFTSFAFRMMYVTIQVFKLFCFG